MSLRIGWLTPFNDQTGVGTFSKAITDAMPDTLDGRRVDLTIVTSPTADDYGSRHRIIDIHATPADSRIYEMFDVLFYNIGNNEEHHKPIFAVLRNFPGVVICHDYVYQHVLAKMVHDRGSAFADYVALAVRYGSADALRRLRQSNITQSRGLRYAVWDSDLSADMPLGALFYQLGSALVVHSRYAEAYAAPRFDGPVLRLGMPYDQRAPRTTADPPPRPDRRRAVVSFGYVQSTKCIHDILLAMAASPRLRKEMMYVIAGFSNDGGYLDRLRRLVSEHALDGCVRFALNLKDAELEALCDEADAFVNLRFPNTEGASVSLVEQLLTGRPVVVFDTGCYAEVPDDAVIKAARPRDVDAIAAALHRLLDDRDTLARIGARGRAYAMRTDCRAYAGALLAFIARDGALLRRRAGAYAHRLLDGGGPDEGEHASDAAWGEALATARSTLNLLEEGRLAEDPALIGGLDAGMIVDYVQAAILRCGTNHRLGQALQAYFADGRDTVRRSRILRVVHGAASSRDAAAAAALPEIVPHGETAFWAVVAALGDEALAYVAHAACFGYVPPDTGGPTYGAASAPLRHLSLADDLERCAAGDLKASSADLEAVTAWLRASAHCEADVALDPLPIGRTIAIGSSHQDRFLELAGFYDVFGDHVWTKPQTGLLYLSPDPAAKRIVLSGNTLDDVVSVSISITTRSGSHEATQAVHGDRKVFELALPTIGDLPPGRTICLAIRSSGCRSPAELGLSEDFRPLGFQLKQVSVL